MNTISAHASCVRDVESAADLIELHAHVCARRQIEIEDHELRSFVVKHSVIRSHFAVGFAIIALASALFAGPAIRVDRVVLAALVSTVGLVMAWSARSIASALRHRPPHL